MVAHYIHFNDPDSEELIQTLAEIPQCPGTCFFMDINRSTNLKYTGGLGKEAEQYLQQPGLFKSF
jgi:hypothetical protein